MKKVLFTIAIITIFVPVITYGEENNAQEKEQQIASASSFNLTLRGIVAGDDEYPGLAIIQRNDNKEEQVFIVNDEIFGLATLEEVYKDHVILLHNGKFKTMHLDGDALSSDHYINSAEVKAARKRVATDYRKRLLSRNGMDLINLFGFRPFHQGGFRGFMITALGDEGREMMETLGVFEGDLITVVNGMRLSEDLEAVDKLKELKTATSVDVIIERNGEEIPFHFELDAPADTNVNETNQLAEEGEKELSDNQTATNTPLEEIETTEHIDHTQTDAITETVSTTAAQEEDIAKAEDDDLGEDWGVSHEDQQYMEEQRARIKHPTGKHELEYDH